MFNTRKDRNRFYKSKQWRNIRIAILRENTLCVHCLKEDILTPARDIDHIKPLETNPELCLTLSNLQPLCMMHHSKKTTEEIANKKPYTNYKRKWL